MRIQVLSDLHLETETCELSPAPGAELLVLAGDIDSTWQGLSRFAGWPVPVVFVAGNHEHDRRDIAEAQRALRAACEGWGLRMLEREAWVGVDGEGRRIRFLGTTRWSDFDVFGEADRARAQRAASHYVKVMRSTQAGAPFDPPAVRREALACRAWLAEALASSGPWDATVVVTHYAPSLLSADPRYGAQPSTASFCNADDDLLAHADLWIHGHVHCRHDYRVGTTRVVCNARGFEHKGETTGAARHCLVTV
ncbi:MAG: metallophosphoesterase [Pseudomonadota bacterium]